MRCCGWAIWPATRLISRRPVGTFEPAWPFESALGDRRGVAEVLIWDSHAAAELGQVDEAEVLARQSYTLHEELGDSANRVFGLGELGVILMCAGKYDEARRVLGQSLELYQDLGNHAMSVYGSRLAGSGMPGESGSTKRRTA